MNPTSRVVYGRYGPNGNTIDIVRHGESITLEIWKDHTLLNEIPLSKSDARNAADTLMRASAAIRIPDPSEDDTSSPAIPPLTPADPPQDPSPRFVGPIPGEEVQNHSTDVLAEEDSVDLKNP